LTNSSTKGLLLILLLVGLFATNSIGGFPQAHSQGSGRVLFDETFPGVFTSIGGTFKSLAHELSSAGYEISALTSPPITKERLSGADVLVISDRWKDFAASEISDIRDFVRSGKGLLLIGVGWSWVDYQKQPIQKFPINVLGQEFSMTVNDDVVADETDNRGEPVNPILHTFTCHPITYGLSKVSPAKGMLPSSLTISGSSQAVITGDNDAYSTYHQQVYRRGGYPPVGAVNTYGSGRVVLLGHDGFFTVMDGTGLYDYDNLRLALNVFAWLSQPERKVTVTEREVVTSTETRTSVRTETAASVLGFSMMDALLLVALVVLVPVAYVVGRRTRKPVSVAELPRAGLFEVSVNVPSAGKTVSIEAGPDHTVGSLVESLASTLNLPKGKAYTVEYAGKLISQADFGRTLGVFGIKEGSKLSFRVID
jgi:hypothetical protein